MKVRYTSSATTAARLAARVMALALMTASGCDDDDAGSDAAVDDGGAVLLDAASPGRPAPTDDEDGGSSSGCAGEPDGTSCDQGRHCIDGRCAWNTCGDGVKAGDEACDDGNEHIGDGCDPACRIVPETCGDAVVQPGEECDDGNLFELDACSNACTENVCGNARIDGVEECDDGNAIDDDDCSNDCTENRCRNGRLDPGEECDDGNRIDDDGCSNACLIEVCGNGEVEGDEECDDGNSVEDDACANACTANVCGNQRLDPGEVCDGDTVAYACADDCSAMEDDDCRPCEDVACTNYGGTVDLVAGCFLGEPSTDIVPSAAPDFAQRCIDVVDCARRTGCGFDSSALAIDCYCGSATVDACIGGGPAADAPCRAEWEAATEGPTNAEVLLRLGDLAYPSGWGYFLMECNLGSCAAECVP